MIQKIRNSIPFFPRLEADVFCNKIAEAATRGVL